VSDEDNPESLEKPLSEWGELTMSMLNRIDAEPHGNRLRVAAYRGYGKTVKLLLDHEAPLVRESRSVLHTAASGGYQEAVRLLAELPEIPGGLVGPI
jgi:hypothetical protein